MAVNFKRTAILCLVGVSALATSAHAGGWNRGEADTDILYEDGDYVMRGGAIYVSPHRKFATINGANATDDRYSQDYWIPSLAAKFKVSDNFACAFTYTQPFGADADYGADAQAAGATISGLGASHKDFITNEYGATCDINMQAGKGRVHLLGGVFLQDFNYTAIKGQNFIHPIAGPLAGEGTLSLEDKSAFGYRLGVAYDIPEYALRAQLMYRSAVEHDANIGSYDVTYGGSPVAQYDAYGSGTLPQSVKLSLQSGVAPGWMVYGSVKWTDWSVMKQLDYNVGGADNSDIYNWKDGWTINAGVAHAFNEKIAGTVNVMWDSGVGTGADIYSDTWTVGAGLSVKAGPGELRFGGAVSYLTEGSQSTADDAVYNATADGDWAYAVSANYKITF